ncbi:Ubiquinol-cytochrome C reductase hinge protein [Oesophagostomum dentatum]|uniref:Cytochrome b-c1 complex subunit 6 n=1 Tax=Oesophagostomum dentatum TaxID=61180 RepID=A0A0B1T4H7_OESDE|nr:Ubiquinol-cytochrome C reductase hinge protein [Oesophagostomum dentatum]
MSDDDAPLEEGVDQLEQWRARCAKKFPELKAQLDECNDRVNSRKQTEETCVQELWDFVEQVDKCAVRKAFLTLK